MIFMNGIVVGKPILMVGGTIPEAKDPRLSKMEGGSMLSLLLSVDCTCDVTAAAGSCLSSLP